MLRYRVRQRKKEKVKNNGVLALWTQTNVALWTQKNEHGLITPTSNEQGLGTRTKGKLNVKYFNLIVVATPNGMG